MREIDNEALKLKRQTTGFTQVEMARKFNVNINTYILWERGVSIPSRPYYQDVLNFINEQV